MTASAKEVIAAALPAAMKAGDSGGMSFVFDEGEGYVTIDGSFLGADVATAILAALDAAGLVVAPREPTPAMVAAAWDTIAPEKKRLGIARLGPGPGTTDVYRAMIAAQEKQR